jgi:hypothetical protein
VKERDHIGFDPVVWIDRLLDVAAGSQFDDKDKAIINKGLRDLRGKLSERED